MKTGIKRSLIGLTGAAVLLGTLAACGGRGAGGWSEERALEMRVKVLARVNDKLKLSAEQKLKLDVLADALDTQRKALRGDGIDPRSDFKALIAGERFERVRAQAMLDHKLAAVQGQTPQVLAALADFYDSLAPAQQQQVREHMDKRRGGRWGRPGF